jgi:serine/threonine protein kinase
MTDRVSEDLFSANDQRPEDFGVSRRQSRDPLVDTTLDGRYHIEEVLGSGGMSVVYKARQLRVNRHVAIKTLRLQFDSKPIYMERFEREISSLCALNHPNIVTVYDAIIGPDGQPYVVMDYLRGRSLEALIKAEGTIDVDRFANISMQICSALDHAHKKGIIHRDLKPGNVVLLDEETEFVKVVDFGLAKLSEDNRKLTQSGELWGSPPYMSPEQCMGESGDERSDIYSLGAVMYEMITGQDPFHGASTIFEFIQRHVHAQPPPIFQVNAGVSIPLQLEGVIFRALEKNPDDRYQSAQELQDAIVEACSGDSGNLAFHPSRASRSVSNSGANPGAAGSATAIGGESGSNINGIDPQPERSSQSQQNAWFAGMLDAGAQAYDAAELQQLNSRISNSPGSTGAHANSSNENFSQLNDPESIQPNSSTVQKSINPIVRPPVELTTHPVASRGPSMHDYGGPSLPHPYKKYLAPAVLLLFLVVGFGCAYLYAPQMFAGVKSASVENSRGGSSGTSAQNEPSSPSDAAPDDAITFGDEDDKAPQQSSESKGAGASGAAKQKRNIAVKKTARPTRKPSVKASVVKPTKAAQSAPKSKKDPWAALDGSR